MPLFGHRPEASSPDCGRPTSRAGPRCQGGHSRRDARRRTSDSVEVRAPHLVGSRVLGIRAQTDLPRGRQGGGAVEGSAGPGGMRDRGILPTRESSRVTRLLSTQCYSIRASSRARSHATSRWTAASCSRSASSAAATSGC